MRPGRNAIQLPLSQGRLSGWLDCAEFGRRGYASYLLADQFATRDFPISLVFSLAEDSFLVMPSNVSFLCRFDVEGGGLHLRRPLR